MSVFLGPSRRERRLRLASILAALIGCLYLLFAATADPLQRLQDAFADALFRRQASSPNIVLVTIGEDDLARFGRLSSWPRSLHALAIQRLANAGARVIAYDVLFADPGADDEPLVRAIQEAGNVVLVAAGGVPLAGPNEEPYTYRDLTLPASPFRQGAVIASGNVETDGDGRVRRIPLSIRTDDGTSFPSLALAAMFLQFGQEPPAGISPGGRDVRLLGRSTPLEERQTMRINYIGDTASFQHLSFADVLDGSFSPAVVEDRIVLVGVDAVGIDRHSAPLLENAAGVEIHANALDTLLRARFIERAPGWTTLLAAAALTLSGAVVAVRWRPPVALMFLVACVVGSLGVAAALFYRGTLIDAVDPAAAVALAVITGLAYRLSSERVAHRELMDLFGRYVSKDVAAELVQLSDRGALQLGGEVREVTVLFADIRGFTGLSIDMHPERLVELLNERFEIIIDAINRRDGIVNKFFGDAVMAFWNMPRAQPDHAWLACRAALDALDRLDALPRTEPPVRFGVGINTGLALAGNVGSSGRREYTVIGDAVNTASRLSGAAGGGEVWVGRRTYDLVAEQLAAEELPPQQLKGIATPVAAFRLVRGRSAPLRDGTTAEAPA